MFSLDDAFRLNSPYLVQKDFYVRSISYAFGSSVFLEILRGQVSEVNVLQLVPGYYLLLLFISFLSLVGVSTILLQISFQLDNRKSSGTKTVNKMEVVVLVKFSLFLVFTGLLIVFNTVIPLGLDSFNTYGEKTLENIWSLDEIISLETILLIILLTLSQIPVVSVLSLNNEKDLSFLPKYWKPISVVVFVLSGILTPTIDGYTQLSFAASAMSLYLILIFVIEKRVNNKFLETIILGS